jgi:drug/metabolite transporter (DMT)-like permease
MPVSRRTDIALVVVAAIAFSTASPLARSADGLSPIAVAAGRCGVAALAIIVAMPGATAAAVSALTSRHKLALVGAGLLLAVHFGLFLAGLATTSLPAAVALVSLEPLAVVLAAWMAFGIRPTRREAIGIGIATLGAAVVARGAGEGEHRLFGDALVLGAVVVYGGYVASARGLRDAMPPMPYAAAVYGVAFLALAPVAVWIASRGAGGAIPTKSWAAVIALGLVPTLIGHTLVQRLSRRVAPALVALVSPGETVGSIAIGAVLMGAWPSEWEWAGAVLVIFGSVIALFGRS